jgi:DNA-binding MarR family transcriptional regulator
VGWHSSGQNSKGCARRGSAGNQGRNSLQMTIRMKDIAKDLGISQATVSKVLREHPDIGEKTRQRVLQG